MSRRFIYGGSFLSCPIEAQNIISAHETATGVTMEARQRNTICGTVSRLKGNGTANGSDLWARMLAAGTRLWLLAPSSDSIASADGFRIEFLTATQRGTYLNFVAGDFQPNGVTGGSTKVFRTIDAVNVFPTNDVAHGCMISERFDTINRIRLGCDAGAGTPQVLMQNQANLTDLNWRVNDNGPAIQTISSIPEEGLFIIQRADSATKTYHINGLQVGSISQASSGPFGRLMGFHSFLRQGSTQIANSLDRFTGYLYGLPSLTANEHADLYEALNWYQSNIITGGR